jgi:AcrR family transcriptional regulator
VAPVNGRRAYSSPARRQQAEATRRAVLRAAHALFVANGYASTTIEQIAAGAGVSKPTVFNAVGNKAAVFRAVRDVAIAGDDEPVPVSQRPLTMAVRDEPDQHRAIAVLARHLTAVARRYGVIYELLRSAVANGDEDLRQVWQTEEDQRLTGAGLWVDVIRSKAPSSGRSRVDKGTAVDVLWFLMAPDNYNRLVRQRGWSERKYERWLAGAIAQAFTPGGR